MKRNLKWERYKSWIIRARYNSDYSEQQIELYILEEDGKFILKANDFSSYQNEYVNTFNTENDAKIYAEWYVEALERAIYSIHCFLNL